MNKRDRFIDYVKNGGKKFICSPQIGAGAGFDTRISGKKWISETTLDDTLFCVSQFNMDPLINVSLPDLVCLVPDIRWKTLCQGVDSKGRRYIRKQLCTPAGNLEIHTVEEQKSGCFNTKYLITENSELRILEYYLDSLIELEDYSKIGKQLKQIREQTGNELPLSIQWAMQPYELLCFPDTVNTAMFALDFPELFYRLMDKIVLLDEKIIHEAAKAKVDFVFLGAPGSEIISPDYYRNFIVPYSKIVSDIAHKNNILIYSHICSPIEPMLSQGFYNEMGIDLFETLSQPPVGNIQSLEDAFLKLDPGICTRGNIGLDLLLNACAKEIKQACFEIMKVAEKSGRKHILAASDYLYYGISEDKVQAMCEAVEEFYHK